MVRVEDGDGAEPRQRRERSRSGEESEVGESTRSSSGIGNRHPVFLDGEAMRGASEEHAYWAEEARMSRTGVGIRVRPSRRPEESIIESAILVSD